MCNFNPSRFSEPDRAAGGAPRSALAFGVHCDDFLPPFFLCSLLARLASATFFARAFFFRCVCRRRILLERLRSKLPTFALLLDRAAPRLPKSGGQGKRWQPPPTRDLRASSEARCKSTQPLEASSRARSRSRTSRRYRLLTVSM